MMCSILFLLIFSLILFQGALEVIEEQLIEIDDGENV